MKSFGIVFFVIALLNLITASLQRGAMRLLNQSL